MKCYLVDGHGIDAIKLSERPAPTIVNEDDVLIDVKACSLNYRDLMIAKGQYQYAPSNLPAIIPLSDMSGIVRQVGKKVSELKPGDRVLCAPFRHWPAGKLRLNWASTFVGGGGVNGVLTEQVVYSEDALVKLPAHLDFPEGSTFTIAGLTAWAAVVTHGKVRPGEWVLLHGTGGVSVFAAQIAHAMGAKTIMTTSSAEKAKIVKKQFNVTETIDYRNSNWADQIKEITGGVDVVVDVVGGATLATSLKICTYGARVAVIGALSAPQTTIETRDLLRHQIQVRGMFMESTEELRALMKAVDTLKLKPHIDKIFPFAQAVDAYRHLESQKHIGKVVIAS